MSVARVGRRIFAVACATMLTACVAVPLSTMWRLRDMTAERFFANDPRQLRVAIRVDEAMKHGTASPEIRIDIDAPSTKPLCYAFALDPVDPRSADEPALEPAAHRRWYAFALSPRGLAVFDRARREVRTKDLERATIALNVTMTDVLEPPAHAATMLMRLDIALDRKDGYVTLIKEMDVKVARDEATSTLRAAPPSEPTDAKTKRACAPAT